MKLTTDIEDQVDAIRDKIYEKIKDMTTDEEVIYFNSLAREASEKYNFQVLKSTLMQHDHTINNSHPITR